MARRRNNEESEVGALLDIAGDRIVELVLWSFFAIRRDAPGEALVPFWVPVVIITITRTIATDLWPGYLTNFLLWRRISAPWRHFPPFRFVRRATSTPRRETVRSTGRTRTCAASRRKLVRYPG
ncbi:MAG: hypothetical protein CME06_10535 [Gemmatimonadetes bacterium]|nr:hypothetical protein [Gemmatimonadota bacterium]